MGAVLHFWGLHTAPAKIQWHGRIRETLVLHWHCDLPSGSQSQSLWCPGPLPYWALWGGNTGVSGGMQGHHLGFWEPRRTPLSFKDSLTQCPTQSLGPGQHHPGPSTSEIWPRVAQSWSLQSLCQGRPSPRRLIPTHHSSQDCCCQCPWHCSRPV